MIGVQICSILVFAALLFVGPALLIERLPDEPQSRPQRVIAFLLRWLGMIAMLAGVIMVSLWSIPFLFSAGGAGFFVGSLVLIAYAVGHAARNDLSRSSAASQSWKTFYLVTSMAVIFYVMAHRDLENPFTIDDINDIAKERGLTEEELERAVLLKPFWGLSAIPISVVAGWLWALSKVEAKPQERRNSQAGDEP